MARLGMLVRTRREVLRLTQREASTAAGISDTTWFSVEQGKKVSNRTLARVERAMQWPRGTIDAVLAGERPPLEGELQIGPRVDAVVVDESPEDRATRLEAELLEARAALARQSGYDVNFDDPTERDLWALTRLSEQTRWELILHVREEKRRDGLISQRGKA